jgi:hypothetical protein
MPQQITPETRERYIRALTMRDNGATFREIAEACGYADAGTARYAWLGGLRLAGRHSEIPSRTPRSIRVSMTNANGGRTTRVMTVDSMESWVTTSTLSFGIEIECVGLTPSRATVALRNAGITCQDAGYTHRTMPEWKVVTDGSLRGRNGSCEVVSPILRGTDGLAEVRTVMKVLREAGARINESCGMHVHVGVDGTLTRQEQAAVIRLYHGWQWAMTAMVLERRINNSWARLRSAQQTESLAANWENANYSDNQIRQWAGEQGRYFALNVAAFGRHGTFELRAHHGSLNGTNAAAWVAVNLAFVEYAKLCVQRGCSNENLLWNGSGVDVDGTWQYGSTHCDASGNATPVTIPNTRQSAVDAFKRLCQALMVNGLITTELFEYLIQRAGNIPTNRNR